MTSVRALRLGSLTLAGILSGLCAHVGWLRTALAQGDTQPDPAASASTPSDEHRVTFELAALTALQANLFELPVVMHGGRATLGARNHGSELFTYAPQLLVEYYRGSTPRELAIDSFNVALLFDLTIALPWLHWELFVGKGANSMQRASNEDTMTAWSDVFGISVNLEYRFNERARIFALLGERWFGDVQATVVGLGLRM
jgi:hypothetical protein